MTGSCRRPASRDLRFPNYFRGFLAGRHPQRAVDRAVALGESPIEIVVARQCLQGAARAYQLRQARHWPTAGHKYLALFISNSLGHRSGS